MQEAQHPVASANLPIACSLSQDALASREEELHELFTSFQQAHELPGGYALQYPCEKIWVEKLTNFILQERVCCPFFTFELVFEPAQGPLWLRLYGGEGVKDLLKNQLLHLQ